ncbi:hypothetical protein PPO43_13790 [Saprospira sp. CCB-QB6]|uniref:hypothetical protein n=1 Tax=Saprospira sp. CCB-QB6 TaxID=3023936 RepID=UPI00234BA336|nr:hypothetical protein [Saprospira sp. CCB-QB6]WCL81041.1 hypothetical protein PPO43_13790 [Saprospira sp. CCB-QB6]
MKGFFSWGLGLFLMTTATGAGAQSAHLYWSAGSENGLPTGLFCGEQAPKSIEIEGPKGETITADLAHYPLQLPANMQDFWGKSFTVLALNPFSELPSFFIGQGEGDYWQLPSKTPFPLAYNALSLEKLQHKYQDYLQLQQEIHTKELLLRATEATAKKQKEQLKLAEEQAKRTEQSLQAWVNEQRLSGKAKEIWQELLAQSAKIDQSLMQVFKHNDIDGARRLADQTTAYERFLQAAKKEAAFDQIATQFQTYEGKRAQKISKRRAADVLAQKLAQTKAKISRLKEEWEALKAQKEAIEK